MKLRNDSEWQLTRRNAIKGAAAAVLLPTLSQAASAATATAIARPRMRWNRTFGGNNREQTAQAVVRTSDGGCVFAGTKGSAGWLVHLNENGRGQWGRSFPEVDAFTSLVTSRDGGFALTGVKHTPTGSDSYLIKTNATGETIWQKVFRDSIIDDLIRIAGGYVLAGGRDYEMRNGFPSPTRAFAVRTRANGTTRWSRTFGNRPGNRFQSLIRARDGGFLFVGTHRRRTSNTFDGWVVKTDAAGAKQWARNYPSDPWSTSFSSIVRAPTRGYLLGGEEFGAWLVRIGEKGRKQWQKTYSVDDTFNTDLASLIRTTDGGYVVGLNVTNVDGEMRGCWVLKIDAQANTLWERFPAPRTTRKPYTDSVLSDIVRTRDGAYVGAGTASVEQSFFDPTPVDPDSEDADAWLFKLTE